MENMTFKIDFEKKSVRAVRNWIANFNTGDVTACVCRLYAQRHHAGHTVGNVFGPGSDRRAFGGPSWLQGLGNWSYDNIRLEVVDESTVLLSADWRMNVGRGVITMEKWVKQSDGNWLLEQDDFEVVEQFKK